jgi:PilZ domain-containing protein
MGAEAGIRIGARMAEDSEGIAYLAALKRPVGSQAATATAPAREAKPPALSGQGATGRSAGPQSGPPSGQQHGSREKRRSPRYQCEGSAEIQEDGHDVRTWATFTNISLHGCYVEAQDTYPVGTALHLKLEANGVRVECKAASVRVNYPYLGMGISFVEMSEENRERLKDLLGAISRPSIIMGAGMTLAQPAAGPLSGVPLISDSGAAVRALVGFFEAHHMLTREDFLKVLSKSQVVPAKG